MLQIALCDDVVEQTLSLQEFISEYCERNHAEYSLSIFTSGEELLLNIEKLDLSLIHI